MLFALAFCVGEFAVVCPGRWYFAPAFGFWAFPDKMLFALAFCGVGCFLVFLGSLLVAQVWVPFVVLVFVAQTLGWGLAPPSLCILGPTLPCGTFGCFVVFVVVLVKGCLFVGLVARALIPSAISGLRGTCVSGPNTVPKTRR